MIQILVPPLTKRLAYDKILPIPLLSFVLFKKQIDSFNDPDYKVQ